MYLLVAPHFSQNVLGIHLSFYSTALPRSPSCSSFCICRAMASWDDSVNKYSHYVCHSDSWFSWICLLDAHINTQYQHSRELVCLWQYLQYLHYEYTCTQFWNIFSVIKTFQIQNIIKHFCPLCLYPTDYLKPGHRSSKTVERTEHFEQK